MNTKDKISKISGLCSAIISLSNFYNDDEFKYYFAYDRVIERLGEIETSLRCKRPDDLPKDIPWSESTNPEWKFDPFVYDGTMTIEDFKKAQEKAIIEFENTD